MDFRSLEILVWLVQDPNLKRTAERLRLTQPTLTKRLKLMEEELGQQLFIRRGSLGLAPTPHAENLAASARSLLDNWAQAINLANMKSGKKPYVNISGPSLFLQNIVVPMWVAAGLHTDFLLHVTSVAVADLGLKVAGQDLDAAFVFDKAKAQDYRFMPVFKERMAIIHHKDAVVRDVSQKENDGLFWIAYRPDRDPLTQAIQAKILPQKRIVAFFEDIPTILNLLRDNKSFATVLPMHALRSHENLRAIPLEMGEQTLYMVYRPERESIFRSFGKFLVSQLSELSI